MTGSGLHRRAALGLMAGGLAASAGACAGPNDGVTRLTLWAMGNEGAATPALLEEFHRLNPDVRVSVQALPWTAAHEKLLTAYAGDSLPDVSQVGNTWIAEMTAIGAATPVPADADDIVAGGFESVMETNRVGGRMMGAPGTWTPGWCSIAQTFWRARAMTPCPRTGRAGSAPCTR